MSRRIGGGVLALLLAVPVSAQEPPAAAHPMHGMMPCMHGATGMQMPDAQVPNMPMQHMSGMPMPTMAPGGMGTMNMHGMMSGVQDMPACDAHVGLAALLGAGAFGLALTPEQTSELETLVAKAREDALALLTPEQHAALGETRTGMCVAPAP